MYEVLPERLWIGNALDARNPRSLFDAGIAAVVDLAYEEEPAVLPRRMVYCRFPLIDGEGNDAARASDDPGVLPWARRSQIGPRK